MKKEDCFIAEKWDYNQGQQFLPSSQNDWNQTLITMINQTATKLFKLTGIAVPRTIEINPNLLPLFETLVFYKDMVLSGRYKINLDDKLDKNIIFIYSELTMGNKIGDKTTSIACIEVENYIDDGSVDGYSHVHRPRTLEDQIEFINVCIFELDKRSIAYYEGLDYYNSVLESLHRLKDLSK